MNDLDFSELEAVSGGIKLGGLATAPTTTPNAADPFGLGLQPQPTFGYPTYPGFDPNFGFAPNQFQVAPQNFFQQLQNNGCNPCGPSGCAPQGFGPIGFGQFGGVPQGGVVLAGAAPTLDPNLAAATGSPYGGTLTVVNGVPVGTSQYGTVPAIGSTFGTPFGFPF